MERDAVTCLQRSGTPLGAEEVRDEGHPIIFENYQIKIYECPAYPGLLTTALTLGYFVNSLASFSN